MAGTRHRHAAARRDLGTAGAVAAAAHAAATDLALPVTPSPSCATPKGASSVTAQAPHAAAGDPPAEATATAVPTSTARIPIQPSNDARPFSVASTVGAPVTSAARVVHVECDDGKLHTQRPVRGG